MENLLTKQVQIFKIIENFQCSTLVYSCLKCIPEFTSPEVATQRYSQEKVQIYRRTPMSKCDFNEVALQLYCYFTLHLFLGTPLGGYFCLSHLWGFNPRLQTVTLWDCKLCVSIIRNEVAQWNWYILHNVNFPMKPIYR